MGRNTTQTTETRISVEGVDSWKHKQPLILLTQARAKHFEPEWIDLWSESNDFKGFEQLHK